MPDLSNGADSGNNSLRGGKKSYTRGALEGNWTEDRCDPKAGRGRFTTRRFVTVLDEAMRVGYSGQPVVAHLYHAVRRELLQVAQEERLEVGVERGRAVSATQIVVLRVLGHACRQEGLFAAKTGSERAPVGKKTFGGRGLDSCARTASEGRR